MENCLIRRDSLDLVSVLRHEGLSSITLIRLDQLVTKDLCGSDICRVQVVLKSLEILSENRDDLETLIIHGLTSKLLLWFEAVHNLLTSDLHKNSSTLLNLTEAFYDYFLILGQASLPVSQLSVVLLQLARFALEPEIHFPLRLEAIRTFNSILESLSKERKKLIQNYPNQTQILSQMAAALLTVGDYELQVSLSETLCRLTPRKDREQRSNQWFSSRDISKSFCDIRDRDFEVDCRHFLNYLNGSDGDERRVHTFPCLRAFLDSTELFPPKDDKLEKFWIDFNLSSGCVSFFIDEPQGFLWGTVHLLKEEVDHFSLLLKHDGCTGAETVLSVQLTRPIMHHSSRGHTVELSFDPEYHQELEAAAGRVFMKERSSPRLKQTVGWVQVSPSTPKHNSRSYSRKKPQSKSQLKILPLSSPSSEEDYSPLKTPGRNAAEVLFDEIRHSTPVYKSGAPVGAELNVSQDQTLEVEGSGSPLRKEIFHPDRKRSAPDSGYLSDQTEGLLAHKRRAAPQPEREESNPPLADPNLISEGSTEGEEPEVVEEEGLIDGVEESHVERDSPVTKSSADLTSGITAAFNIFKTQLQKHFTSGWQNVEDQVLQSLKDCQQQVSSLLTAVHQHRLVLLQTFERNVSDQLNQLQENSSSLTSVNTQILSFFQSEMQRLGSFCDGHLQRLKSLNSEEAGPEH